MPEPELIPYGQVPFNEGEVLRLMQSGVAALLTPDELTKLRELAQQSFELQSQATALICAVAHRSTPTTQDEANTCEALGRWFFTWFMQEGVEQAQRDLISH